MSTLKVYNNNILLVSQEVIAGPDDTIDVNVHGEIFVTDAHAVKLKKLQEENEKLKKRLESYSGKKAYEINGVVYISDQEREKTLNPYVTSLEAAVNKLREENENLQYENKRLRYRVKLWKDSCLSVIG